MKKLYFIAIFALMSSFASAQSIDIQTNLVTPVAGQVVNVGTPFALKAYFKNLGPTTVNVGDSFMYYFHTQYTYYRIMTTVKNINDTILVDIPTFTYSSAPGGTYNFCINGYIKRPAATITDPNHANDTVCRNITITSGTGIGTTALEGTPMAGTLSIAPNPANGIVHLGFATVNSSEATVRVMDVTGRVVMMNTYNKSQVSGLDFQLNVSSLTPGVYFVEMQQDNARALGKLIRN